MPLPTIAIIGGGASAAALTVHLARQQGRPFHLHLYDPAPQPWLGVAYGTAEPWHVLNVRAKGMSLLPDEPGHFAAWLASNGHDASPEAFAPRAVYGQYLAAMAAQAADALMRRGGTFTHHRTYIRSIQPQGDGLRLVTQTGDMLDTDIAVLATGNPPPRPLPGDNHPAIIQSPWFPESGSLLAQADLSATQRDDHVLMVGTGLTMVDITITLMRRGYKGRITAVSRNARLPRPHKDGLTPRPCSLSLHPAQAPRTAAGLYDALRHEVQEARKQGHDWREVIDGLRPVTTQIWQQLPPEEQQRGARRFGSAWSIHRHRMAAPIYQQLQEWMEHGRLSLHSGAADHVEVTTGGAGLHLKDGGTLSGMALINCTGPDLSAARQSFLSHLIQSGLAQAGGLGWGLATNAQGGIIGPVGTRLFAIGPLRTGDLWESTAMPEIRTQAKALAEVIGAVL
jgi:uncharacterized NAD(P)/FAD-binding protein YdhS